jgi:uncharacterized protein YdaU (DUF1376 family)
MGPGEKAMHYLPFYTGDYLRHTRHLSITEHGAYLLLLTYCWDMEGPVPLDERKIFGICNARSSDEMEAVRRVLNEFFVRMDDGWYNTRIMKEIERAKYICQKRVKAGKASGRSRKASSWDKASKGTHVQKPIKSIAKAPSQNAGSGGTCVQQMFSKCSTGVPNQHQDQELNISSRESTGSNPKEHTSCQTHVGTQRVEAPSCHLALDPREREAPNSSLSLKDEKTNTAPNTITITYDWNITAPWIAAAASVRPDLTREQILFSSKRFKFHCLAFGGKSQDLLADWLSWIMMENASRQPKPARAAPVGAGLGSGKKPRESLFRRAEKLGIPWQTYKDSYRLEMDVIKAECNQRTSASSTPG